MALETAEEIVRRSLKAWISGDFEGTLASIADDCVYALHISNEALPFAGEAVGKAAIEAAFRMMRAQFDYLLFRPHHYVTDGGTVRVRVEHMYRHRATGEIISGNFRLVFFMRDGFITRMDEYHDRAMVEAFMRLINGAASRSDR